jgi:hypothetical protein
MRWWCRQTPSWTPAGADVQARVASRLLTLMTTAVLACAGAGCSAASDSPAPADGATAIGAVAAPEVAVVQKAMDRFNATAGGPVTAQQSVLSGLVSAAQNSVQHACPPVTVTISMEPVYARLAASPGWRPRGGSLPGTIYAVPTLIRIYHGDRIIGTDLTDLHLAIEGGRMTLPAVCLR